jgi:hypothetical protein
LRKSDIKKPIYQSRISAKIFLWLSLDSCVYIQSICSLFGYSWKCIDIV